MIEHTLSPNVIHVTTCSAVATVEGVMSSKGKHPFKQVSDVHLNYSMIESGINAVMTILELIYNTS